MATAAGLPAGRLKLRYGQRVNPVDRAYDAVEARIMVLRHRSASFDHLSRAVLRYLDVDGGRLAPRFAYSAFSAASPRLLFG